MAITIQVNNIQYGNFIKAEVNERIDAMCKDFSMVLTAKENTPLPFQGGESCVLFIDGVKKLTGFIERSSPGYSESSHTINVSGRDKLCDIVDSLLEARDDINGAVSLLDVCNEVIEQIGADISVTDLSFIPNFNPAEDIIALEPAQNAFDFLQGLATKRNVLLTSDPDGNLVIKQSVPTKSNGKIQNILGATDNNTISADSDFDITERYNKYVAISGLNPAAAILTQSIAIASIVNTTSVTPDDPLEDTQIRKGRQWVLKPPTASSDGELINMAKWELNIRKARSVTYNVTVQGHTISSDSSEVWQTDTLVNIVDEFCGINDFMLLNTIKFTTDLSGGDRTQLSFVQKNSYTLETSDPANDPGSVGAGFMDFGGG